MMSGDHACEWAQFPLWGKAMGLFWQCHYAYTYTLVPLWASILQKVCVNNNTSRGHEHVHLRRAFDEFLIRRKHTRNSHIISCNMLKNRMTAGYWNEGGVIFPSKRDAQMPAFDQQRLDNLAGRSIVLTRFDRYWAFSGIVDLPEISTW